MKQICKIARSHRGYYCSPIGTHATLWRTGAGFAFAAWPNEEDAQWHDDKGDGRERIDE